MPPTVTPNTETAWRWIDSGPGAPSWNMAVDQALLDALEEDGGRPVFRLYQWAPAAISLGRFQAAADVTPPAGAVVVRRLTGGAAIYHREDELTYSVVAPYQVLGGGPRAAYAAIHGVIEAALRSLGVPLSARTAPAASATRRGMCFDAATCYDLAAGDRKLVGSAQRRRGRTFLQHGSLPRSPDPLAPGAIGLSELVDPPPTVAQLSEAIRVCFERTIAAKVECDALRSEERERALILEQTRYGSAAWTGER